MRPPDVGSWGSTMKVARKIRTTSMSETTTSKIAKKKVNKKSTTTGNRTKTTMAKMLDVLVR